MPDISMCANEKCTLKDSCFRFTAKPNPYRQSYAAFTQDDKDVCEYYWNNEI